MCGRPAETDARICPRSDDRGSGRDRDTPVRPPTTLTPISRDHGECAIFAADNVQFEVAANIFEQKRVDSMLAVDLVLLSAKRVIQKAVVFTGDSDFLPPIWAAKNEGVIVGLWHGSGDMLPHRDLWDSVDERTPVTDALINTMRRP